ncbi:hypothetical protein [Streptomyces sp. NPDC088762]|uniref:hypothetical protein n=1 Tax=Streptomyces sp. NPDC088762 TaxID=3365891 RepID=UPI0037FE88F4
MNMLGLRLLLVTVLLGGALSGCSLLSPFTTCEGTASAVAKLNELPALALRPAGAVPIDEEAEAQAYCTEDSGDAGLTARRLYAYDGSRTEVQEYYARAAPAAGWHPVHSLTTQPEAGFSVFCFESDRHPSVTLAFESPEELREVYGVDPGPEPAGPGSRIWFQLFAEAATDGSRMGC